MDLQALQIRILAGMPCHLPDALKNGSNFLESRPKLIQVLHHDWVQHSILQSVRSALLGQKSYYWLYLAFYPDLLPQNPVTNPPETLNEKRTDTNHFSEHFPANCGGHPVIPTGRKGLFIFRAVQQLLSLSSSVNNQKFQLSHNVSLHSSLPTENEKSVPYAFTHGKKLRSDKDNEGFSAIAVIFRHIFKVLDVLRLERIKH